MIVSIGTIGNKLRGNANRGMPANEYPLTRHVVRPPKLPTATVEYHNHHSATSLQQPKKFGSVSSSTSTGSSTSGRSGSTSHSVGSSPSTSASSMSSTSSVLSTPRRKPRITLQSSPASSIAKPISAKPADDAQFRPEVLQGILHSDFAHEELARAARKFISHVRLQTSAGPRLYEVCSADLSVGDLIANTARKPVTLEHTGEWDRDHGFQVKGLILDGNDNKLRSLLGKPNPNKQYRVIECFLQVKLQYW